MTEEPKLVCVRTCQGLDLAQIYKSKLEAAEIPTLLKYESAGPIFGITIDGLGRVDIMVPEPFAADAEALLQDLEPGLLEADDESQEEDSDED